MNFENFTRKLPPMPDRAVLDKSKIKSLAGRLPPELITFYEKFGCGAFGQGIIWFVDPLFFDDIVKSWGKKFVGHTIFARTAFADLFSIKDKDIFFLPIQYHTTEKISDDIVEFGEWAITSVDFMNEILMKSLFDECQKKFGSISDNECYAIAPALALGGQGAIEDVRKESIMEYIDIVSQIHIAE